MKICNVQYFNKIIKHIETKKYNILLNIFLSKNFHLKMEEIELIPENEFPRIFKIRKTLLKLIEDRGFKVEEEKKAQTYDDWKNEFKSNYKLSFFYTKGEGNSLESIYILYFKQQKLGVSEIQDFSKNINEKKISCGIMVVRGIITPLAKQKLKEFNESLHIQLFQDKELVVNVTEHELVPKHILLTKEEKDELLKRYKLKESQLPKILVTDPVAKYLGLQRADVVKIIRASETAGRYITYRIAI